MEIPLSELIDRITVLRIKVKNTDKPEVKEELSLLEDSLEAFEKESGKIDIGLVSKLQKVNQELWDLVTELINEKKNENLEGAGKIYIRQHIANKKRVEIKNKIAEKTRSGFKDISVNSNLRDSSL